MRLLGKNIIRRVTLACYLAQKTKKSGREKRRRLKNKPVRHPPPKKESPTTKIMKNTKRGPGVIKK